MDNEMTDRARRMRRDSERGFAHWLYKLRPWDAFVTLTFAPPPHTKDRRPPATLDRVRKIILHDHNLLASALGHEFAAIYVIERHKSGELHIHGIIDGGGLAPGELRRILDVWEGLHGIAKGRAILDEAGRRKACQYISKELGEDQDVADIVVMREIGQLPIRGWRRSA